MSQESILAFIDSQVKPQGVEKVKNKDENTKRRKDETALNLKS